MGYRIQRGYCKSQVNSITIIQYYIRYCSIIIFWWNRNLWPLTYFVSSKIFFRLRNRRYQCNFERLYKLIRYEWLMKWRNSGYELKYYHPRRKKKNNSVDRMDCLVFIKKLTVFYFGEAVWTPKHPLATTSTVGVVHRYLVKYYSYR